MMTAVPRLSDATLAELRALSDAELRQACDVFLPTTTRGPGATEVTTWTRTATALPCRYVPARVGALEQFLAGARGAPMDAVVLFPAGTALDARARLHVTGTVAGIAIDRWLAVQGAPEPLQYEVRRRVRVVPADAVTDSTPPFTPLAVGAFVWDGNSIMAGNAVDVQTETVPRLVEAAHPGVPSLNFAVGGGTTTNVGAAAWMTSDAALQIDASFRPALGINVLGVWEIRNEITATRAAGGTITARQALDRFQAYCQARRLVGFKVIVFPVLPTTQTGIDPAQFEADRVQINAWLLAEQAEFCDAVVTLPDALLAPGANHDRTYYAEDIHPNAAGNVLAAAAFETALATVLATPPLPITRLVVTPLDPTLGLATVVPPAIVRVVVTPTDPTLALPT